MIEDKRLLSIRVRRLTAPEQNEHGAEYSWGVEIGEGSKARRWSGKKRLIAICASRSRAREVLIMELLRGFSGTGRTR